MSSSVQFQACIEKLQSPDPNVKFAALKTLTEDLGKNALANSEARLETKFVHQVVALLSDQNDEIKDQARNCLAQLVKLVRPSQVDYIITQLVELVEHANGELRGVAGAALKAVVAELRQDDVIAPRAIRKIVPLTAPTDILIEALATLDIVALRFQAHVPSGVPTALTPVLCHNDSKVCEHAIDTIANFVSHLPDSEIQAFVTSKVIPGLVSRGASVQERSTTLELTSALARYVAPNVEEFVPDLLKGLEKVKRSGLQTLEQLVTHCSNEMKPYISRLIAVGVKYANHASTVDHLPADVVMKAIGGTRSGHIGNQADPERNDIEDEELDEEDGISMIRRRAIKLWSAVICTYPERLGEVYRCTTPTLITRSCDRRSRVRHEAWSALTVLIRQTRQVLSDKANFASEDRWNLQPHPATKEIITAVDSLVPRLLEALVKTLSPEVTPPLPALVLLDTLLSPLPKGSLMDHVFTSGYEGVLEPLETLREKLCLLLVQSTTLPTFKHMLAVDFPSESALVKLTTLMRDPDACIASEATHIALGIIDDRSKLPKKFEQALRATTHQLLEDPDTSPAMRELACKIVSTLFFNDISCDPKSWELVRKARVPRIVQETIWETDKRCNGRYEMAEEWLEAHITWCVDLICDEEEGGTVDIGEAMDCLMTLLEESRFGMFDDDAQDDLADALPSHLVSTNPALEQTLKLLDYILSNRPGKWWKHISRDMLPQLFTLVSESLPASSMDALVELLCNIAANNGQKSEEEEDDDDDDDDDEEDDEDEEEKDIATRLLSGLRASFDERPEVDVAKSTSKCLAAVVRGQKAVAPKLFNELSPYMKPSNRASEGLLVLSLLTLGEIARFVDIKSRENLLDNVFDFFASDSEHIQDAATLAVAHICTGSPKKVLSTIMDQARNDEEQRPFLMRALEEFVFHYNPDVFKKQYADGLWDMCWNLPLQHQDALDSSASCMSRIFIQDPAFLPRLEAGLKDPSPITRALVVSTMGCIFRHTAKETGDGKDEDNDNVTAAHTHQETQSRKLKALVTELLSLLDDKDMNVKTKALSAMNQVVRGMPRLVKDNLAQLQPKLCDAAQLRTEELEARLGAYEAINALATILSGLSANSDKIKTLCHTITQQLAQIAPVVVAPRVKDIAAVLEANTLTDREAALMRTKFRTMAALNEVVELCGNGAATGSAVGKGVEDRMDLG